MTRNLLSEGIDEVRILSRDEKKQDDMRKLYKNPRLNFYLGDVRDSESLILPTKGVDYIFHAAALKQVPSCEFFPLEAVKTNVLGTENVINAALKNEVEKIVCLSTDKAVYPINAMGMSKALMEKVAISKSRTNQQTDICITRYGNVMASRGSVIPLFVDQALSNQPLTITDPEMTRFMMTLDDAVDLVFHALESGRRGEILVQKSPASTIQTLAEAISEILDLTEFNFKMVGTRHGEKLYETLLSREEMVSAEEEDHYYRVSPDDRDLNYDKYFSNGMPKISKSEDYNSHNTIRLDLLETIDLLRRLGPLEKLNSRII